MSQLTLEGPIAGLDVLDMTSGLRGMQWETKIHADINLDASAYRKVTVRGSFQKLPFKNESFEKILFDPPHVLDQRNTLLGSFPVTSGEGPVIATWKYGCYRNINQLRKALYEGTREAHRVLKSGGWMIFKWSDAEKSYDWAVASVDQRFRIERISRRASGAGTGNGTWLSWYRKP